MPTSWELAEESLLEEIDDTFEDLSRQLSVAISVKEYESFHHLKKQVHFTPNE